MNTNVKQHAEFSSKAMWAINKIALPYCTDVTSLCPTGCCSAVRGPARCVCVCVWHSYLQLGEYFLDVAEAALRDVHVLFVRPSLEDGLGGVREVLVEGEVCSHGLHFDSLALFRPDFTHVLFPARYDLQCGDERADSQRSLGAEMPSPASNSRRLVYDISVNPKHLWGWVKKKHWCYM